MSPAERTFERQLATFLGSMACELPSGRSAPPRAMLRRARVHMSATVVVGAAFVAMTILLATFATRGLVIGGNSFPAPSLIGGAGTIGDPNGAGAGGAGPVVLVPGSLSPLFGAFDGFEGSYDRSVLGRGPDGGSWGGPVSRGDTGGSDGPGDRQEPPGSVGDLPGGSSGSGGRGWAPPPPIWIGGTSGGFPPAPEPGIPGTGGIAGSIGDEASDGSANRADGRRTGRGFAMDR